MDIAGSGMAWTMAGCGPSTTALTPESPGQRIGASGLGQSGPGEGARPSHATWGSRVSGARTTGSCLCRPFHPARVPPRFPLHLLLRPWSLLHSTGSTCNPTLTHRLTLALRSGRSLFWSLLQPQNPTHGLTGEELLENIGTVKTE